MRLNDGHVLSAAAVASLYISVIMASCTCNSCNSNEKDTSVEASQSLASTKASKLSKNVMTLESMDNTLLDRKSVSDDTSTCSVNGSKVCLTPGCVRAASMLLEHIDFNQDPCDNFYKFACGTFIENTILSDDTLAVTMFTETIDTLNKQLRIIMEEPLEPDEPKPYRLVKHLYNACMNTDQIEETGLKKLLQIITESGGWPVLGTAFNESSYDWKDDIYKFIKYGYSVNYMIKFSIEADMKNTTVRILQLDQATLGLNSQFLVKGFDERLVQAYYEYMVSVAVLLGADRTAAKAELEESLLFEMRLAKIFLRREERRNMTNLYNPMNISELQQQFPSIPWVQYITNLLPETITLKPDEIINVVVPRYIRRLETILKITSNRVLANYLKWRIISESISYLTKSLRKLQLGYHTVLSGVTQQRPRWIECVETTSLRLKVVVGSLYIQRFFKEESKENVIVIVDGIRAEMNKILNEITWMDEETRKNALDKSNAIKEFIGYPEELLITENLEKYYEKLELSPDRYLESILNVTKFEKNFELSQLREVYNKSDWRLHAAISTADAGYSLTQNYIEFPAGILQGIFFSNDRPMYLNFAPIGYVIGHELMHALDDEGSQFDKDGKLTDWWEQETKKQYLEKAACIIEQYQNYVVEEVGLKVNGIVTQGENIADCGGIKEANRAYNTWESKFGVEPRLPGFLNYTSQQMFWISAANIWCSKYRLEILKMRINTDAHAPDEFRVIGPFSNREEFSKDFNCPIGSKMNPAKKCEVF